MKQKIFAVLLAAALATPLFAGALTIEADDPRDNPEARAKNAVVVVRITACHSPEKTSVTATAEGVVTGKRKSIPLRVLNLSAPGTFAVAGAWPHEGAWSISLVATNPDYRNYATGAVVPLKNGTYSRMGTKQVFHAPTEDEIDSVLKQATLD